MLKQLSIRDKLLSMLIFPLLAVVGFAGTTMIERWQEWSQMQQLGELATVSPVIGKMAHDLQIERGLSAGFIGSKGAPNFEQRLVEQRQVADVSQDDLRSILDELSATRMGASLVEPINRSRNQLGALSAKRREVSSQQLTVGQMAKYYTTAIGNLLTLIQSAGSTDTEADSGRMMTAYTALLQAKERAGLERAMGANGFGKGAFAPNIHRRFIDLIGQQSAFIDVYRSHATAEQIAFFDQSLAGSVSGDVDRMRKIAIDSQGSGDMGGITGPVWFDTITKKIDQLHEVELRMANDLARLANHHEAAAAQSVFWQALIIVGVLAVTISISVMTCLRLVRPIKAIRECVADLAKGKNVPVPATNLDDEIGDLARSLETVYQRGLEAARLRTALDSSQTLVMVANRRLEIVYANPSILAKLKAYEQVIRQDLPNFDAETVIGSNIDIFHKNPTHNRDVIGQTTTTHNTRIRFGDINFELSISPINNDGNLLGVIVEWRDKTAEDHAMAEIEKVVKAAGKGDFSRRINSQDIDGTHKTFAEGINQLSALVDTAINDLSDMLGAVAEGDLTLRLSGNYEGALGELQNNANQTAERLGSIVANIQSVSQSVSNAAGEINAGTDDLSNRTEQAASNLEETAAATEEMSATVRRNAENASTADELANETNRAAAEGGDIVQQVVGAMTDIKSSTGQMTDVISVIDEIAFQTNLLALNASVEAARAGEAGKGFAVVAQEVRALAQRSATAADDIKGLIKTSNNRVQYGVDLVNQAGTSLTDIVDSIGKVAGIVREISGASQEQAQGIQEISSSVNQMDEMTQQNSALVEESAAAANTLSDQASQLSELTRFFKLDHHHLADQSPAKARPGAKASLSIKPSSNETGRAPAMAVDGWNEF